MLGDRAEVREIRAAQQFGLSYLALMIMDERVKMMEDPLVDYTLAPKSIMKTAEFMAKVGTIKDKPASWKDLFFSNVYNLQAS